LEDKNKTDLENEAKILWEDPSEENWNKFREILKRSKAKYYRVKYEKSLGTTEDLRKSYAEIFDSKYNIIAKVPIFKKVGSKIEGATINLEGLLNANKPE